MRNDSHGGLTRRAFIGTTAATVAGLSAWRPGAAAGRTTDVCLATLAPDADAEAISAAVRAAALRATDFEWLAKGDTVAIKPAWNSGNPYPYTTHPAGVAAMTALLKERGAGRVIVTDQAGVEHVRHTRDELSGSSRELWAEHGLFEPARAAGAELVFFEEGSFDDHFLETTPPGSHWEQGVWLPKVLKEVDHVVYLPRVGSHILAGVTLGLKSAVGWLRDDSRMELHRDSDTFFEKIAEISATPVIRSKLRLTLSVAHRVLTTFGPDRGYVATPDIGLVVASADLAAHDAAAVAWYLWNHGHSTPEEEKGRDPKRFPVSAINQRFVGHTWGDDAGAGTGQLPRPELQRARDDLAIARAAELWGGYPEIRWQMANSDLPTSIVDRMTVLAG
jgi:uncharacterized protein (DUF362 family)